MSACSSGTQLRKWADRRCAGRSWFDAAPLDARGRNAEVHGKVIAELSLGF